MNYIREQVGGKKNRYKEEGYNLDLTYITPRMIAMAFPGSGFEKIYRNSVDDVQNFFLKHHGAKYMVVNLSGRDVDESKLTNVFSIDWEDHQAPTLQKLFITCRKIAMFLESDQEKVVAIHCNHGKGRTGTIVCCFLLFCNMFKNADLTMQFYAKKRFETNGDSEGFGVTQPCQIQYIRYFERVLKNPKILPRVLAIRKCTFMGKHKFDHLYFKLKEFDNNKTIVSTKKGKTNSLKEKTEENHIIYKMYQTVFFCGDAKLQIKAPTKFGSNVVATFSFNTAFVENKELTISTEDLSPYSLRKTEDFGPDFKIELLFKDICECPADIDFNLKCEKCRDYLVNEEGRWKEIRQTYKLYEKINELQKQQLLGFFKKEKIEENEEP